MMMSLYRLLSVVNVLALSLLLLSLPSSRAKADTCAAGELIDPATKHLYKKTENSQTLVGAGVRVKKILGLSVNVYSAAMYMDKFQAGIALRNYKSSTAKDLAGNEGFSKAISEASFGKSIILRMARDVNAKTMVDALAESVVPRLSGSSNDKALKSFEDLLSAGS